MEKPDITVHEITMIPLSKLLREEGQYDWSPESVAAILVHQEEPVFNYNGALYVPEDVAARLRTFIQRRGS